MFTSYVFSKEYYGFGGLCPHIRAFTFFFSFNFSVYPYFVSFPIFYDFLCKSFNLNNIDKLVICDSVFILNFLSKESFYTKSIP